jgi:sugar (pentulose or hexulose) kinase
VGDGVLIGLDVGTTSSKAVVYTAEGRTVAEGRASTVWRSTPSGVEIDARELLASAIDAVNRALGQTSRVAVLGLGVASMGESGVLLDRQGTPVAPVIAWHDSRDQVELAELDARLGAENFSARTGLPFRTQWSLTKHHWLVRHHHAVADAVRRMNISEWIIHGLGGEEVSELSLASRTGWLDLATRTWWADSLSATETKESLLPPLVTAGTALGRVTHTEVSAALAGAILTAAGHDHQAAAVGVGAIHQGDELDSCGTAEALVRTVQPNLPVCAVVELARAGVTTGWHVLPDRWCLLGGTEGGRTLQRVRALLRADGDDLDALDRAALATVPSDVSGLELEVTSDGVAVRGADQLTRPEHIWRSALEHVTREAQSIHGAMSGLSGPHRRLVVTGGWSNSRALLHVKRDMLGPLERSEVSEAGCRGAALLAGLAAGVYETPGQFPDPA